MFQGPSKPGVPLLHPLPPLRCLLSAVGSPAHVRSAALGRWGQVRGEASRKGAGLAPCLGTRTLPSCLSLGQLSPLAAAAPAAAPSFRCGFSESSLRNRKWQPSPDNPPRAVERPLVIPLCWHVLLWPAAEDTGPWPSRLTGLEGGPKSLEWKVLLLCLFSDLPGAEHRAGMAPSA